MAYQQQGVRGEYWSDRTSMMYYKYVDFLVGAFAFDAKSMIDVGTANTRYIESFNWIPERYSLDIKNPYSSETVKGIEIDFLKFEPTRKYDFVTCLQVLEHIPNVQEFAQKLLQISDKVLISVPYLWPEGSDKEHVHDPIDLEKVNSWMGIEPSYYIIVEEPLRIPEKKMNKRLLCYYQDKPVNFGEALKQAKTFRGMNMIESNTINENVNLSNLEEKLQILINNQKDTTEILRLELQVMRLRDKISDQAIKNENSYNEISKLENELEELERKRKAVKKQKRFYKKSYDKVISSTSWKITYPLRRFVDIIKGKK
ncbi:methyltransferase domain-containing protein [Sutcliffiella cohnii]|uniref:methyltransferase domain-containing protein n=1 Tax=Sutcliffiella cohnii TaxID=33932 RepID=UPI002E1AFC1F|nr:hypothetical protein [Sutcliffiella cohnii]